MQLDSDKKTLTRLRYLQAFTGLHANSLQRNVDSSQSEKVDRTFFLAGWMSEEKHRRSVFRLLGPAARDETIFELQRKFVRHYGHSLRIVSVSHEYPTQSPYQRKRLAPKTLIELTNKADVGRVQRLLNREPLWTKDYENVYHSQKVRFERCISKEERRKRLPLLIIAESMKYWYYENPDVRRSRRKRTWTQAIDEFERNFHINVHDLSIRRKKPDALEAQVKMNTEDVSPVVDCYISAGWIDHITKFWDDAARYHLGTPYPSLDVISFPHQDILPPTKEAQVQPELKSLSTQQALTKKSNKQDLCTLERLTQTDSHGQRIVGKFCHPKYVYQIYILYLADLRKKYHGVEMRTADQSGKRSRASIDDERTNRRSKKRGQ